MWSAWRSLEWRSSSHSARSLCSSHPVRHTVPRSHTLTRNALAEPPCGLIHDLAPDTATLQLLAPKASRLRAENEGAESGNDSRHPSRPFPPPFGSGERWAAVPVTAPLCPAPDADASLAPLTPYFISIWWCGVVPSTRLQQALSQPKLHLMSLLKLHQTLTSRFGLYFLTGLKKRLRIVLSDVQQWALYRDDHQLPRINDQKKKQRELLPICFKSIKN